MLEITGVTLKPTGRNLWDLIADELDNINRRAELQITSLKDVFTVCNRIDADSKALQQWKQWLTIASEQINPNEHGSKEFRFYENSGYCNLVKRGQTALQGVIGDKVLLQATVHALQSFSEYKMGTTVAVNGRLVKDTGHRKPLPPEQDVARVILSVLFLSIPEAIRLSRE